MPRCAVLGSPIAHSLSPVMHERAYAELGLEGWTYGRYEIDEDGIGTFLAGLDETWRGLSLTMPLKRAVLPYLDTMDDAVHEVGGANTVIVDIEGRHGFNTDVTGGVEALRERGVVEVEDAVVIGAGATAESMIASLRRLGLRRVTLAVRSLDRGEAFAERLRAGARATSRGDLSSGAYSSDRSAADAHATASSGVGAGLGELAVEVTGIGADLARSTQIVVSTVPSEAVAPFAQMLVTRCDAVFDVIYDPWPTALAWAAQAEAVPVISGLDLLAHQAAAQVRLMTGHAVSASILREAALAELGVR